MASTDDELIFSSAIEALKNVIIQSGKLRNDLKLDIQQSIEDILKVHSNLKKKLKCSEKTTDFEVSTSSNTIDASMHKQHDENNNNLLKQLIEEVKSKNMILIENKTLLEEKIVYIQKELQDYKSKVRLDIQSNIECQKSQSLDIISSQEPTSEIKINKTNNVSLLSRPTYKEILIMKTKVNKSNDEMRKDLITNIDPKLFKDIKVTNSRNNGNIILQSNNNEDLEKVTKKINEKLNSEISISKPKKRLPRLKIKKVINDANLGDDDLVKMIVNQNDITAIENFHLKVIYKTKPVNKYFDICIEMDPKTFAAINLKESLLIGFESCKFYEAFDISRCFRCNEYEHKIKDCGKENPICGSCSEAHLMKTCVSDFKKCINCIQRNAKLNLDLNIAHPTWSHECPTYLSIVQKIKKKINYSE